MSSPPEINDKEERFFDIGLFIIAGLAVVALGAFYYFLVIHPALP